jgi:hypothetical protein
MTAVETDVPWVGGGVEQVLLDDGEELVVIVVVVVVVVVVRVLFCCGCVWWSSMSRRAIGAEACVEDCWSVSHGAVLLLALPACC